MNQSASPPHAPGAGRQGARRGPLPLLGGCALAIGMAVLSPGASSARQDEDDLASTRAALEKWVEVRRVLSQERRDWVLGRQVLEDQIGILEQEIESVRAKAAEAQASIVEADLKRAELIEQNDRLAQAASALTGSVVALEAGTRELLQRVPDSLREHVRPFSQRMPDGSGEVRLSLSERFQNVVVILDQIDEFNGKITVSSEVHTLPGGSAAEVTALYVGLGQGYYVSADGLIAGVGTAGPQGWTWEPANESAPEVARAIAILQSEQVADYVRLPVHIQ